MTSEADLLSNAQELVSAVDRSAPVGLDVGVFIPMLRLLEAGLPGADAWWVEMRSTGIIIRIARRIHGDQKLTAAVEFGWEKLRLFRGSPDVVLREAVGNVLAGLEDKEHELTHTCGECGHTKHDPHGCGHLSCSCAAG